MAILPQLLPLAISRAPCCYRWWQLSLNVARTSIYLFYRSHAIGEAFIHSISGKIQLLHVYWELHSIPGLSSITPCVLGTTQYTRVEFNYSMCIGNYTVYQVWVQRSIKKIYKRSITVLHNGSIAMVHKGSITVLHKGSIAMVHMLSTTTLLLKEYYIISLLLIFKQDFR